MELMQRIANVWAEVDRINNWDKPHFDWGKAYVASLFSKLAYLHIPQYELKRAYRENLIPCVEYREIIKGSGRVGVEDILKSSDIGEFFIVERPYAIVMVVKVKKVLFIFMRGTQQLYDWLVKETLIYSSELAMQVVELAQ